MYNRYERCVAAGDCLASVAGGAPSPLPGWACVRSTSRRAPRHVYADKFSWQELVQ